MKIDLLILQLAVIFLPGIIWARLDVAYAAKVKPTEIEFFLRAFLFGITVYVVEFVKFTVFGGSFTMADLAEGGTKEIFSKNILYEVLAGLGIGLLLSIIWLYAATNKWLARFLQGIRATNRYGDEDVWDYTFNSPYKDVDYVHFRDFTNQCVYAGWVDTFSETDKLRELVLRAVIVYNFDGEELYKVPRMYLARPPENMHIEFPYVEPENGETADD
jgi:hypothetical protein